MAEKMSWSDAYVLSKKYRGVLMSIGKRQHLHLTVIILFIFINFIFFNASKADPLTITGSNHLSIEKFADINCFRRHTVDKCLDHDGRWNYESATIIKKYYRGDINLMGGLVEDDQKKQIIHAASSRNYWSCF